MGLLQNLAKRRVKIIATLGPASEDESTITKLVKAGATVFRLNLSHGGWKVQEEKAKLVREVEEKLGMPLAVLLDTRGPEVRVVLEEPLPLKKGQEIVMGKEFKIRHKPRVVKPRQRVVVGDGEGELVVVKTEPLTLKACTSFLLKPGKSLYFQGSSPSLNPPKEDAEDITAAREFVDYIAVSFVESASTLKKIASLAPSARLIAKIESKKAVENLDEIIMACNGVMVARGDLGVDAPIESVPIMQKAIIEKAKRAGKPVIVATQMLESMINSPRPTRAEVTDIALAVWQGASALMLAAETAVGKFPVKAVEVMHRTIVESECVMEQGVNAQKVRSIPDAIGKAVDMISLSLNPAAIICLTKSGFTAQLIAQELPSQPFFVFCSSRSLARKLWLLYGALPVGEERGNSLNERIANALNTLKAHGCARKGDVVLFTYAEGYERTNALRLVKVDA